MYRYTGKFVELNAPQRSPDWVRARKKVTASVLEKFCDMSSFGTQYDAVLEILGRTHKETSEAMRLGTEKEDVVAQDVMTNMPSIKSMREPSLCLPVVCHDFNKMGHPFDSNEHPFWYIGGSPDRFILYHDGSTSNMEIKYTTSLYRPLRDRSMIIPRSNCNYDGSVFTDYFGHIWRSHYMQMQQCMFVCQEERCMYAVGHPEGIYVENLLFDRAYYFGFLSPKVQKNILNLLLPDMTSKDKGDVYKIIEDIKSVIRREDVIFVN